MNSESSSADCHRLWKQEEETCESLGFFVVVCFTTAIAWVWTGKKRKMFQPQQQQSGSDYSRINYHPVRAMMPIPADIVVNNNNVNNGGRPRPVIGAKPIPPPKPFPRPPPSVRPRAALPPQSTPRPSCSSSSSRVAINQRRPLTCVNDMALNPLYMCRFRLVGLCSLLFIKFQQMALTFTLVASWGR